MVFYQLINNNRALGTGMSKVEKQLSDDVRNSIGRSCIDLLTRFYFGLDTRSYDDAIKSFSPDGTWIRFGEALVGVSAIRKKMEQRPTNVAVCHILSNLHFTSLEFNRAHTRGYVTVYAHPFEGEVKDPVQRHLCHDQERNTASLILGGRNQIGSREIS